MSLIDELKEKRKAYEEQLAHRLNEVVAWTAKVQLSKQDLADLDKAISALTPEDGNDALLADQQDTPPQSSPQASETDAAIAQERKEIAEAREFILAETEKLGYEAFGNGVAFEENPHTSLTTRLGWARGWCEAQSKIGQHTSHCSLWNLPAFEPLPCNCGGIDAGLPDADDVRGILAEPSKALTAPQQDTPPQSNAQESVTDAANWQVRVIGLRDPITGKAFLARNVLSPPLSDEGLAMLEEAITNEMPEGFSVYHPEDMMFPVETMVEFWWPDGKREISAIDKDWTEAPFAYRIISEPAEASEPAEIISTLTGDPAIEPESGLHGEPLPPSELDSQAQPQTKSEQSDNPPEEKFSALKHGGEAGGWAAALGLTGIKVLA